MSGFIYFLASGGRVKIGYSTEPAARISSISTSCPFPVEVLATIPGSEAQERAIHRGLAKSRRFGEWFDRTDDVAALLDEIASGGIADGAGAADLVGGVVRQPIGVKRNGSFEAIFAHWPTVKEAAADLGLKYTTVQVARMRGRLSPTHWPNLIAVLASKGITVTAEELMIAYCSAPTDEARAA